MSEGTPLFSPIAARSPTTELRERRPKATTPPLDTANTTPTEVAPEIPIIPNDPLYEPHTNKRYSYASSKNEENVSYKGLLNLALLILVPFFPSSVASSLLLSPRFVSRRILSYL